MGLQGSMLSKTGPVVVQYRWRFAFGLGSGSASSGDASPSAKGNHAASWEIMVGM